MSIAERFRPENLAKFRRLAAFLDRRFPAHVWKRLTDAARGAFHDFERTIDPEVDPVTAAIAARDAVVAPHLRNIVIGEGSACAPGCRILVHANGPGEPYGRVEIGRGVRLGRNTSIEMWSHNRLRIGDFTSLGENCALGGDVEIGRHCVFSWNIFLATGDHHARDLPAWLIKDQDARAQQDPAWSRTDSRPIVVDDDVWMGWGAFIKQGVHIGRGAIIGAYAVVSHDVPPYSIQAGVPSREIGKRLAFAPPAAIDAARDDDRPYLYAGFLHRQEDRVPGGTGMHAYDEARVVLAGGRFRRLRIRARADAPAILDVSVNGAPAGELRLGAQATDTQMDVPATTEGARSGLLAAYNVVDLRARDAHAASGLPAFELQSIGLVQA